MTQLRNKKNVYSIICLTTVLFWCKYVTCQGCSNGGFMNASTGTFTSVGFPSDYPPNTTCLWQIRAPHDHVIKLSFNSFRVQKCAGCKCDGVRTSNTLDFKSGNLPDCGLSIPDSVYSDGRNFYVKFWSNAGNQEKGFSATYSAVPKNRACAGSGILNSSSGSLQSDGYPIKRYPYNTKCDWHIVAPPGNQIKLTFEDFKLEHCVNCNCDYVAIHDGLDYNSPKLEQLCSYTKPPSVLSTGRYMYVKFSSDLSSNHKGFRATYTTLPKTRENCLRTVELGEKNGTFSSPHYPNRYTINMDCSWKITVPSGYDVKINFTSFNVQSCGETCSCDFVEVRAASLIRGKRFCGTSPPDTVVSHSTVTFVRFKSDSTVNGLGFKASYTAVKRPTAESSTEAWTTVPGSCTTELTENNGTFQTPKYDTPDHVNCTWLIVVPRGYHVKLEFQEFDLEQCASCKCAFVEVRDGTQNSSSLLGRYCGTRTPSPLESKGRYLLVRRVIIANVQRASFKARYQAVCMTDIAKIDESSSSLTYPAIIGLVIGLLLFLGLVGFLTIYMKRRLTSTEDKNTGAGVASIPYNPGLSCTSVPEGSPMQTSTHETTSKKELATLGAQNEYKKEGANPVPFSDVMKL